MEPQGSSEPKSSHAIRDRIRRAIEIAARSFGIVVVPTWGLDEAAAATTLRAVLARSKVDCAIDVGANLGQFRNYLRNNVRWTGPIHSFEPLPELAAVLRSRAKGDSRWTIYEVALGPRQGSMHLNEAASPGFSSFLTPGPSDVFSDRIRTIRVRDVPVRTLQDILREEIPDSQRIFLKIDTQGYDLEVLKGLHHDVNRIAVVQIEVAVRPLYREMPTWQQSLRALSDLGFDLCDMWPVSRDDKLRAIEFDCLAVRRDFPGP